MTRASAPWPSRAPSLSRLNPVVAFKLSDSISIGGGLSANYARINLEQGLRPLAAPLENFFRFTGDGWAWAPTWACS